jgi:ribosomal protein S3AE
MKVLENYPKKVLRESIRKLQDLIGSKETILKEDDILIHIDNMVFTNRSSTNVNTLHESFVALKGFIKENAPIERTNKKVSIKLLTKLAAKKFNDRFDSLSESDREIFKTLKESSEEQKNEMYDKVLVECVELINEKMSKADDMETKEKLMETQNIVYTLSRHYGKMYKDNDNEFNLTENLMKLYRLKEGLS